MNFCHRLSCFKISSSRAVLDDDFEEVKLATIAVDETNKATTKLSVLKRFVKKLFKRKDRAQHAIVTEGHLKVSVPSDVSTRSISFAKFLPGNASQATTPCLFINAAAINRPLAPSSASSVSCSSVNGRTPPAKTKPASSTPLGSVVPKSTVLSPGFLDSLVIQTIPEDDSPTNSDDDIFATALSESLFAYLTTAGAANSDADSYSSSSYYEESSIYEDDLESFSSTPVRPPRLQDCDNDVVIGSVTPWCARKRYLPPTPCDNNGVAIFDEDDEVDFSDLMHTPEYIRQERQMPFGVLVIKRKVDPFFGHNAYSVDLFPTATLVSGCVEELWDNPYGDMFEPLEFKLF